MSKLIIEYTGVSKGNVPFYRTDGFDELMSLVKNKLNDQKLTNFNRDIRKNSELLEFTFGDENSKTEFKNSLQKWAVLDAAHCEKNGLSRLEK